jgi:hypothetical protein
MQQGALGGLQFPQSLIARIARRDVSVDAAADKIIGHTQEILEQDILGGTFGTKRRTVVCGVYHGMHFK